MHVSELLATKFIENEFVAYQNLQGLMASSDALSDAWLYDRVICAVRLLQPQLARYSDWGVVGAGAIADSSYCPHRPQRDDRWVYLYVTSCWHCVRVCLIRPLRTD